MTTASRPPASLAASTGDRSQPRRSTTTCSAGLTAPCTPGSRMSGELGSPSTRPPSSRTANRSTSRLRPPLAPTSSKRTWRSPVRHTASARPTARAAAPPTSLVCGARARPARSSLHVRGHDVARVPPGVLGRGRAAEVPVVGRELGRLPAQHEAVQAGEQPQLHDRADGRLLPPRADLSHRPTGVPVVGHGRHERGVQRRGHTSRACGSGPRGWARRRSRSSGGHGLISPDHRAGGIGMSPMKTGRAPWFG